MEMIKNNEHSRMVFCFRESGFENLRLVQHIKPEKPSLGIAFLSNW